LTKTGKSKTHPTSTKYSRGSTQKSQRKNYRGVVETAEIKEIFEFQKKNSASQSRASSHNHLTQ